MKTWLCLMLAVWPLLKPSLALASGAETPEADFSFKQRPDSPLTKFAEGNLGIIRPSWALSYLVVAYRHLAGPPPTAAERKVYRSIWGWRLKSRLEPSGQAPEENQGDGLSDWLSARKAILGAAQIAGIETERQAPNRYFGYSNCLDGAFSIAAKTLEDRISKYGAGSTVVKDWLTAQDIVFDNCASAVAHLPSELPQSAPRKERYDRAYQIAAANFYSRNFDAAEKDFGLIAGEKNSPWRGWARLGRARTFIRRAELQATKNDEKDALIARASSELASVLDDPAESKVHDAARDFMRIICSRFLDTTAAANVAKRLLKPEPSKELYVDFDAYTRSVGFWRPIYPNKRPLRDPDDAKDDLTEWIGLMNGQGDRPRALKHWTQDRTLPWLTAALVNASSADPNLPELLGAAAKVDPESPAWPTLTYYRLRREPAKDAARQELDGLLPKINQTLSISSRNLFAALRFSLSKDLDDLLRHAPRVPAAILGDEYEEGGGFSPGWEPLFDEETAMAFNTQIPLRLLVEASQRDTLPPRLRIEVARVAWVRAILLEDYASADELAKLIRSIPGAAPRARLGQALASYLAAKSPEEKRLAAAVAIGRNPGLSCFVRTGLLRKTQISLFARGNWWPAKREMRPTGQIFDDVAFLSDEQHADAKSESAKILAVGSPMHFFSRVATAAASDLPKDPRVPELLHDVVSASQLELYTDGTAEISRAAFRLLQSQYPNSEWAKRTPYWFR